MKSRKLHIAMQYVYMCNTSIDIPAELLEGKTEEEQKRIAYQYALKHIDEIPIANDGEYVPYSDFREEDIEFED